MYTTTVPVIAENNFDKEKLLHELRRCKADRVAFALYRDLNHTFTSPGTLKRTGELIEYFRGNGFETVIWIGETLGHDQVTKHPDGCETPYRRMKLPNKGTVDSFCPTDERFVRDLGEWLKKAAELHPDLIMLDDDFRMNGGCVCDAHVARMNREAGEALTADEWFRKAFTGGRNKYREIWMKVQSESLYTVARVLRQAVDGVDPAIRLGVCAAHYLWDADGTEMEKLLRILAGNTKPFLRSYGAPYHSYANLSRTLGESVELERCELEWSRNWGVERITEGDTYPRPRFYCAAAYLECFDQILRADGTADGILKYAEDYCSDIGYERGYADAWERNLPLYQEIEELFSGKKAVGLRPYMAPHLLGNADLTDVAPTDFRNLHHSAGNYNASGTIAAENNLPTAYGGTGAKILFGENARHISDGELNGGCILDLTAAKILHQRGVDVGIAEFETAGSLTVSYLGGLTQYFTEEDQSVRISGAYLPERIRLKEGAEVLSEFVSGDIRLTGWFRYENEKGQRFLIFPVCGRELTGRSVDKAGYLNGYALRRMLIKQTEWLNKTPLDAYAEGNYPRLYTLVKKNETALAVGLWNLFEDRIDSLTVRIHGDYSKIRFVNCTGVREGDTVRLTSVLHPYEFSGFELYQ